jgi:hypothetical protein
MPLNYRYYSKGQDLRPTCSHAPAWELSALTLRVFAVSLCRHIRTDAERKLRLTHARTWERRSIVVRAVNVEADFEIQFPKPSHDRRGQGSGSHRDSRWAYQLIPRIRTDFVW